MDKKKYAVYTHTQTQRKWMKVEDIMLSELSHKKGSRTYFVLHMELNQKETICEKHRKDDLKTGGLLGTGKDPGARVGKRIEG
jgi:hypothetical protein